MLSFQASICSLPASYSKLAASTVPILSRGILNSCCSPLPFPAAPAAVAAQHPHRRQHPAYTNCNEESLTIDESRRGGADAHLSQSWLLQQLQQWHYHSQNNAQQQQQQQQQTLYHWFKHPRLQSGHSIHLYKQQRFPSITCVADPKRHHYYYHYAQPWHYHQTHHYSSNSSSSSKGPKNVKGALPDHGPSPRTLRAIPFTVSRSEAASAFLKYHSGRWYQSRQQPALSGSSSSSDGGFKETYLPFWVGSGVVRAEVRGAEVGHDHLVTRYDRAKGRAEPRWETVWSRVSVAMMWDRPLTAADKDMQIYASWKYYRHDVDALKPGTSVTLAREITPGMLKSSVGDGSSTRRVGPFTLKPQQARRIIMTAVEAAERQTAEQQIAKVTGASQVRFVDMHCTWYGSTGAAAGNTAAGSSGGLDLMPVYVPSYVFGWWHGGVKVRTFVSGVDSSVGGAHVLDDKKVATVVAAATTGATLLFGAPLAVVFWAGLVVPFLVSGIVARFWPLVRDRLLFMSSWIGRGRQQIFSKEQQKDYSDVDWNASFVRSYTTEEQRHQYQEQQESYQHAHKPGGDTNPFETFQEFMQDPFKWFERQYAKSQQQQWQQQYNRQQQQRRGTDYSSSSSSGFSSSSRSNTNPRDPKGYYKTLGVDPGATTPEVQAAFRGLALQHHPDRYQEAAEKARATKRFQHLTEAYQVLRDPKKRRQYDAGQFRA